MICLSLAFTSNLSDCLESLGYFGEYLIKITSIELEHSGLPVFFIKKSIHLALLNAVSDNILIESIGNELLTSAIDFR